MPIDRKLGGTGSTGHELDGGPNRWSRHFVWADVVLHGWESAESMVRGCVDVVRISAIVSECIPTYLANPSWIGTVLCSLLWAIFAL